MVGLVLNRAIGHSGNQQQRADRFKADRQFVRRTILVRYHFGVSCVGENGRHVAGLGERIGNDCVSYEDIVALAGLTEAGIHAIVSADDVVDDDNPRVKIQTSPIHGLGVFTAQFVDALVDLGYARVSGHRTPMGRYLNHSDQPNARVVRHGDDLVVRSVTYIARGEEVTVDYRQVVFVNLEAPARWRISCI
jgi:hypothetical protein